MALLHSTIAEMISALDQASTLLQPHRIFNTYEKPQWDPVQIGRLSVELSSFSRRLKYELENNFVAVIKEQAE